MPGCVRARRWSVRPGRARCRRVGGRGRGLCGWRVVGWRRIGERRGAGGGAVRDSVVVRVAGGPRPSPERPRTLLDQTLGRAVRRGTEAREPCDPSGWTVTRAGMVLGWLGMTLARWSVRDVHRW